MKVGELPENKAIVKYNPETKKFEYKPPKASAEAITTTSTTAEEGGSSVELTASPMRISTLETRDKNSLKRSLSDATEAEEQEKKETKRQKIKKGEAHEEEEKS